MQLIWKAILVILVTAAHLAVSIVAQVRDVDSAQLLPVRVGGKAGYIDTKGTMIVRPQFNRAWKFSSNFALVELAGYHALAHLDSKGKLHHIGNARGFSQGVTILGSAEAGFRVVDMSGKLVAKLPSEVEWTQDFSDGLVAVQLKDCIPYQTCGKIGFVNTAGVLAIPPRWSHVRPFNEGVAVVNNGDEWFLIDKKGNEIARQNSERQPFTDFSEGLSGMYIDGKWGYIDRSGGIIVPAKFDGAKKFTEGLAAVRVGCLWGYIDKAGAFVIEPTFGFASEFSEGRAAVDPVRLTSLPCRHPAAHGKLGYIDRTSRLVVNASFDLALPFSQGVAEIVTVNPKDKNDLKHGYIDMAGNFVWKPTS